MANAKTYKLMDGEKRNQANPDTFSIPELNERNNLALDECYAKLGFVMPRRKNRVSAERMWVRVKTKDAKGTYTGELANEPAFVPNLFFGTPVRFKAKHVLDIQMVEEEDSDE